MRTVGKIEFKKIKRISPSQFTSMRSCAYKSLLAEAFDKVPLLPVSPSAYLGTVLHKMLELISRAEVRDEEQFKQRFAEEISNVENQLRSNGYDFFVPLQMNVRDFGIKKIQLKKHLNTEGITPSAAHGTTKYLIEKWYESNDKLVGGKIDLVIENSTQSVIVDFKTGRITEDILDDSGEAYTTIKPEYEEQLKLYAYLYFENNGRFPNQLLLVDLAKKRFNVEFVEKECVALFEKSKQLLHDTNDSVDTGGFNARPSETNCKYCLYRPACSFYIAQLSSDNPFNDVCGFVKDVIKYQNGNVSVFLEMDGNKYTITGFSADKNEYLRGTLNKRISLFNLRKEAVPFFYSATRSTMIYEQ